MARRARIGQSELEARPGGKAARGGPAAAPFHRDIHVCSDRKPTPGLLGLPARFGGESVKLASAVAVGFRLCPHFCPPTEEWQPSISPDSASASAAVIFPSLYLHARLSGLALSLRQRPQPRPRSPRERLSSFHDGGSVSATGEGVSDGAGGRHHGSPSNPTLSFSRLAPFDLRADAARRLRSGCYVSCNSVWRLVVVAVIERSLEAAARLCLLPPRTQIRLTRLTNKARQSGCWHSPPRSSAS